MQMRGLRRMGCREDEEVVVVDIIIVLLAGRSGTRQAGGFLFFMPSRATPGNARDGTIL